MEAVEDVIVRCDNLYKRWKADQEERRRAALEIIDILSKHNKEKAKEPADRKRKRRRRRLRRKNKECLYGQSDSEIAACVGLQIDSYANLENRLDAICQATARGTNTPQEFAARVRDVAGILVWQALRGTWRAEKNGVGIMCNIMEAVRAIKIGDLKKDPCKAEVARDVTRSAIRTIRRLGKDALKSVEVYADMLKHRDDADVDEQQAILKIDTVAATSRLYAALVAVIATVGSQYCTFYARQN